MNEEWRPIEGTDGQYEVSNTGKVRNAKRKNELKLQQDNKGYCRVRLTVNRIKKSYRVHREVAKAFISNPENKPQVNHIDGNKENNAASNLEWVTNIENASHALQNGLWENVLAASEKVNESRKTPIIATNIKTGEEKTFKSMSEAERTLNTKHINAVISGERKQASGYTFRYAQKGGDAK